MDPQPPPPPPPPPPSPPLPEYLCTSKILSHLMPTLLVRFDNVKRQIDSSTKAVAAGGGTATDHYNASAQIMDNLLSELVPNMVGWIRDCSVQDDENINIKSDDNGGKVGGQVGGQVDELIIEKLVPKKVAGPAKKRPRVVVDDVVEVNDEKEEGEDAEEGTSKGPMKRNVTAPGGDRGGDAATDKVKINIVVLACSEDNCQVTVTNLAAFKDHLLKAHGIELHRCYVEGCGVSFESKSDMSKHIRVGHSQLHQWPCYRCSKTFKSYHLLRTHQSFHQVGIFQCDSHPDCDFISTSRAKVRTHIEQIRKLRVVKNVASGGGADGGGNSQEDSIDVDSQESVREEFPLLEGSQMDSQPISQKEQATGQEEAQTEPEKVRNVVEFYY